MVRFILVRHGQTEWNRQERFRGRSDIPLNEAGLAQAAAAGQRIAREWQVSAVYSSPMTRAIQTAAAVAGRFDLVVQPHAGLNDIDFGQWQGLDFSEVKARWPEQADDWLHHPDRVAIPGGEPLADVRGRAMHCLEELTAQHDGQTVVLVGHTVINKAMLTGILGLDLARFWHIAQDNCAISVFEARHGDYFVVATNDTCHLRSY